MKIMNWGKGIAIVIGLFMLYIVSFVYRAFQEDADLVRDDYYEHEMSFDQNKEDKNNYYDLNGDLTISRLDEGLSFQFPEDVDPNIEGNIKFYRADKKDFDREFELDLNEERQQLLSYDHFYQGFYEVTVQWEAASKGFIYEERIEL
jgi:hypothetical protein